MLDVYPDLLRKQIHEMRELCGQFPVRFLASQCDASYSTINRFINGHDIALSTFINIHKLMYDENDEMNDKFKEWEG